MDYNPSTLRIVMKFQGQFGLQSKLQASQGNTERSYLNKPSPTPQPPKRSNGTATLSIFKMTKKKKSHILAPKMAILVIKISCFALDCDYNN